MMPELTTCHDCGVEVGQPHVEGCDIARCLQTGLQRLSCDQEPIDGPHDCGSDVWTGEWPGTAECREYGWITATPVGDIPELNRLIYECRWDPARLRWVKR